VKEREKRETVCRLVQKGRRSEKKGMMAGWMCIEVLKKQEEEKETWSRFFFKKKTGFDEMRWS